FRDYQLPEAVIKFKQGFGRLIRTASDQGIVVVLDPRIVTKQYGRTFLDSLPDSPVKYEPL
ncbi:MAG: helicase C-terminal domain-containing protein, partial [Planctomycetota bacterium]